MYTTTIPSFNFSKPVKWNTLIMNIAVILLPLLLSLISALLLTLSGDLMIGDRTDNTVITLLLSGNC